VRLAQATEIFLSLDVTLSIKPVHRRLKEVINCCDDRALAEFDQLYAKFMAAHRTLPSQSDKP
jgi:hypothetical protein